MVCSPSHCPTSQVCLRMESGDCCPGAEGLFFRGRDLRMCMGQGQGCSQLLGQHLRSPCPLAPPECGSGGAEGVCSGVIESAAWRRRSRNPGCCQLSDPPKREPFVLASRSSRPPPGCPQPANTGPVPPSYSPSWPSELCREMPNQLAWCYVVYLSFPF